MKQWMITDKGDPWMLRLVDGRNVSPRVLELCTLELRKREPGAPPVEALDIPQHYSRQQAGTPSFTRNGQNLVFISESKLDGWVLFRPTPGVAHRPDGEDVWECALYRKESSGGLASDFIREAVELGVALWGPPPPLRPITRRRRKRVWVDGILKLSREWEEVETTTGGIITYVKPSAIRSANPGYCYKTAGWSVVGESADGKPMLRAPQLESTPDWREWQWHGARGGKLRRDLEAAR